MNRVTRATAKRPRVAASPGDAPTRRGPKRKLEDKSWFDVALSAMAVGGVNAVRIDQMAASLGVTKGSFYVLFDSRETFLERLLDHWRQISTLQVIEELREADQLPLDRLARIFAIPVTERARMRARIEAGFRLWGYDDPRAARTLSEIDHHRLLYFQSVAIAAGLSPEEAKVRAFLIYGYIISDAMLSGDQDEIRSQCRAFLSQGLGPDDGQERASA